MNGTSRRAVGAEMPSAAAATAAGSVMDRVYLAHQSFIALPPAQFIQVAAVAGFAGVSLRLWSATGTAHPLPIGGGEYSAVLAVRAATRTSVIGIEAFRMTRSTTRSDYQELLEQGAALGARRLLVVGGESDVQAIAEPFARLCADAETLRIAVDLEFFPHSPVRTIEHAAAIVQAAGHRNGFLAVDALHLTRSGGSAKNVESVLSLVGSVHLCDAPLASPGESGRIAESRCDRLRPGEGELPLDTLLGILPVELPIGIEVPLQDNQGLSPADGALRLYKATARLLAQSARLDPAKYPDALAARLKRVPEIIES
jgi:sugar phosphate isomerase/epimerase